MAEMKTAAYICKGCGIGERLEHGADGQDRAEGRQDAAGARARLPVQRDGVQMIRDDIDKEAVTHVMIAACSRRAKTEAFYFPDRRLARANLREGVIWSQPETDEARETTQEMADDYVRMGCAEVKKMKVPAGNPNRAHATSRILVVGGGVSGMTAAIEVAEAGYDVVLVEKSGALGGWAAKLVQARARRSSRTPTRPTPASPNWSQGRARTAHQGVSECDHRQDRRRAGPLRGRHRHRSPARRSPRTVGAIVQATGFTPYDMKQAAGTRRRQEPERGRPGSAWKSWRLKPPNGGADQAPVRRRRSQERRVRPVRRPARRRSRQAPALLLRPLLHHQHQAGDVLQGRQSRRSTRW